MRTYEPLKFLGRLMVVPLTVEKGTPPVTHTGTWEQEPPYRFAPTIVIRMPFFRAAWGIGIWLETDVADLPSEQILRLELEAANAAYDAYCAVNGDVKRARWETARAKVAEMGLDPDEEMGMMQDLGVFE